MVTRVLRTASATLSRTFYVGETATDATGSVAVSIVDANGTSVSTGTATSSGVGSGTYTYVLPAQSQVKLLTVSWTGTLSGPSVTMTDQVEICGGFFFTLAEGRASDSSLSNTATYPTADLTDARQQVEEEAEWICDRAFVTRYGRAVLDGSGSWDLTLPFADVTVVRRVSMAPVYGQTFTDFTTAQLGAVAALPDGTLRRTDYNVFTEGSQNILIEVEYGLSTIPADLKKAALERFRSRLNFNKTGIPERASSFTSVDGGTYRLSMPDAYRTGVPDVDAAYSRYSRRIQAQASADQGSRYPASRRLDFDPQRDALFHGGSR